MRLGTRPGYKYAGIIMGVRLKGQAGKETERDTSRLGIRLGMRLGGRHWE